MTAPGTRWVLAAADPEVVASLSQRLALPEPIARVLVARGITDPDAARAFLHPDPGQLHDPFLLHGMDRAVSRIGDALARGEKILVYGDYDVDGVCSVAILVRFLQACGAAVEAYIPHRIEEGYGLHEPVLRRAAEDGTRLVITVDTGVTAVEPALLAARLGLDLIITDHHQFGDQVPPALALIHPRHPEGNYPFGDLCGAAVAFKLVQALAAARGEPESAAAFFDLVALATVADVVPLRDENRVFVVEGLRRLRAAPRPGLAALCQVARVDPSALDVWQLAFVLAPRLNAAGRMREADLAVQLLLAESPVSARELALVLEAENRSRQEVQERILAEARRRIAGDPSPVLVLSDPGWHAGVVGIVAARLVEETGRPVLLAAEGEGVAHGSARSVPGFPITECLSECADLLDSYGGHDQAAGFRLPVAALGDLRRRLCDAFRRRAPKGSLDAIVYEAELQLSDLSDAFIDHLERLAPFGEGNPEPRFLLGNVPICQVRSVGRDGRHLKLVVGDHSSGFGIDAIAFGMGERLPEVRRDGRADLLVCPRRSEWQGRVRVELRVAALKPAAGSRGERGRRAAAGAGPDYPGRSLLADVYRWLRGAAGSEGLPLGVAVDGLTAQRPLSPETVRYALRIFEELGLVRIRAGTIEVPEPQRKVRLTDSPTYLRLLAAWQEAAAGRSDVLL